MNIEEIFWMNEMNLFVKKFCKIFFLILFATIVNICYSQDSSLIKIPVFVGQDAEKRNMTFVDIIEMREPQEVAISPDGKTIAFIIKQAFIDMNIEKYALYIIKAADGSIPIKLVEDVSLNSLKWSPNGDYLTYLALNNGSMQIFLVKPLENSEPEILFEHKIERDPDKSASVLQYEISRDGQLIIFTSMSSSVEEEIKEIEKGGIIFDEERHTYADIINNTFVRKPFELWKYNLASKKKTLLRVFNSTYINDFQISPDSRNVAVSYFTVPTFQESIIYGNMDIGILDIEKRAFATLVTGEAHQAGVSWSPDSKYIAYANILDAEKSSIDVLDIETNVIKNYCKGSLIPSYNIIWSKDKLNLFVLSKTVDKNNIGRQILCEISLSDGKYKSIIFNNDYRISSLSFNESNTKVACIFQNPTTPPEIGIIKLNDSPIQVITSLNPEYKKILKGNIEELIWENEYGAFTNGYLIKPNNFQKGKKYPFLMIHYAFSGNYISDAEWMTVYPVLLFAQQDFIVLLMNHPRIPGWKGKDYKRGSVAEGFSALSSMKTIINKLSTCGTIDSKRCGVMGVSQGCFLSEFALTHSSLFQAASVSNGGNYNPGVFWLADKNFRRFQEKVMGGPPLNETLKNWIEFSPVFNSYKIQSPVLMQYSLSEAIIGMDFFTSLKSFGIPVEFRIFPNDAHVISQPIHRLNAMKENLDWFTFWLKGEENPDPAKEEQYERWRKLRVQYEALIKEKNNEN